MRKRLRVVMGVALVMALLGGVYGCSGVSGETAAKIAAIEKDLEDSRRELAALAGKVARGEATPEDVQTAIANLIDRRDRDLKALVDVKNEGTPGWLSLALAVLGGTLARGRPAGGPLGIAWGAVEGVLSMMKKPEDPPPARPDNRKLTP